MRKFSLSVLAVLVGLTSLLTIFGSPNAFAADVAANTLKVSPVRTDVTIEAGESKVVDIVVTNPTKNTISVHPTENDFEAGDEEGTPDIILNDDQYSAYHSLKRLMSPIDDFTLAPNETQVVKAVITVPADANPGGYFGAVRFEPSTPDSGGQVNVNSSIASLIILTVPGQVTESMKLTNFTVERDGKSAASFLSSTKDLDVLVRFQNTGDLQLSPSGKITVKKGSTTVYSANFNTESPRDLVLPSSARKWNVDIPSKYTSDFGHYTVYGTFTYGSNNQTVDIQQSFWVITPLAIIIAAIIIVLVVAGIVILVMYLNRRKKSRAQV